MQHLTALTILCFATLVYGLANAHVFLQSYDRNYIKDLYEHSQWSYKTAVRSIGDDGLYQAAAIRILESGKIYTINPEVPTAGIYLYVASIYLFNNPYFLNPLVYILAGYLVYLLARQITTPQRSLFAVALFALDPFLGSQLGLTMLDLPLLFWILLAVYTTIRTTKTHHPLQKIFFCHSLWRCLWHRCCYQVWPFNTGNLSNFFLALLPASQNSCAHHHLIHR
ncbi:MAG: hypothetical protein KatS3mg087_0991 [Patescibacteria group bacterium]|nr:MAG: hypothetical protein KatS3mg087_0991 [Patescibacteria group bacterium]